MRYQGRITGWKDDQGFGFVTPNGGGTKAFVHIKAFQSAKSRPQDGDLITYELSTDTKGRSTATKILFALAPQPAQQRKVAWSGSVFALIFYGALCTLVLQKKLPIQLLWLYSGASVIAFLMYGLDKSSARSHGRRIPEQTLQVVSLLGGWPGALVAQKLFRHKTQKVAFQRVFWVTVVVNLGVLGWFN
ncbi:MAG TPA: DUF1294 domain-containing protein [Methylophilaceae bacterium]|nr:DUF1294 domain-containing protein [Methylophilaceae bacterium]